MNDWPAMSSAEVLLAAFAAHSIEGIRSALDSGADVGVAIDDKSPTDHVVEMYYRSNQFPECLRLMMRRGAGLE